jgi:hypothetical protein
MKNTLHYKIYQNSQAKPANLWKKNTSETTETCNWKHQFKINKPEPHIYISKTTKTSKFRYKINLARKKLTAYLRKSANR